MSNADLIAKIERDVKAYKEHVDFGAAIDRLSKNKDFQKVITEGYLKKEAVRLVHLKANPAMQTADRQSSIDKDINAIGSLVQFLDNNLVLAGRASDSIFDAETSLEELRADVGDTE